MLKVLIGGGCIGKSAILHDQKRDAVGKRPVLIGSCRKKVDGEVLQLLVDMHDFSFIACQNGQRFNEGAMASRAAEMCAQFQNNGAAHKKGAPIKRGKFYRSLMKRIVGVNEGDKVGRVCKDRFQDSGSRFGAP